MTPAPIFVQVLTREPCTTTSDLTCFYILQYGKDFLKVSKRECQKKMRVAETICPPSTKCQPKWVSNQCQFFLNKLVGLHDIFCECH